MTDPLRSILVAIDFGEASARAVSIAGALASRSGASLRLLHADASGDRVGAERLVQQFGQEHTTCAFTSLVDDRPAAKAILRQSVISELIVMGTHGRHGPSRWWLGSVAESVLRETSQPLLIVRAEPKPSRPDAVFARVLVVASAPVVGAETTEYARVLAGRFSGHVVDARYEPVEPAVERTAATLLVVASPSPRDATWLSDIGQPIVRFFDRPILFVPEGSRVGAYVPSPHVAGPD